MKIKQGFILHRIGDDYIIMQDGSSNVDFSKVSTTLDITTWEKLWR